MKDQGRGPPGVRGRRRVYGVREVWRQLRRGGLELSRCQVERLLRELGLFGAMRGELKHTAVPVDVAARPGDKVDRDFHAPAPDRLWVADLTHIGIWSGFVCVREVYVAVVMDVFSRRMVGWRCSRSLRTDPALDAHAGPGAA